MSYHDDFRRAIDRGFADKADELPVYMGLLQKMNAGHFERDYIDIFLQHYTTSYYDIYDAWFFGQLHALSAKQELQILKLPLSHEPSADTAVEVNNQKLAGLPDPFTAHFWGGQADFDGEVEWRTDILVGDRQQHWPSAPGWE